MHRGKIPPFGLNMEPGRPVPSYMLSTNRQPTLCLPRRAGWLVKGAISFNLKGILPVAAALEAHVTRRSAIGWARLHEMTGRFDFESAVVVYHFGCGANRLESLSKHANVYRPDTDASAPARLVADERRDP
jgi:hypothetical protein